MFRTLQCKFKKVIISFKFLCSVFTKSLNPEIIGHLASFLNVVIIEIET